MDARLERTHIAYTFFCTLGAELCAQPALISKISASELGRKFIKSALLVGRKFAERAVLVRVARLLW